MGGSFRAAKPEVSLPALPLLRNQTEMLALRRLQQTKRFSNISHGDHIVQTLEN